MTDDITPLEPGEPEPIEEPDEVAEDVPEVATDPVEE